MKTCILAMAMMMGVAGTAQEKKTRHEPLKPEQKAELQVKEMTLALDLNDKQQKEVRELLIEKGREREVLRKGHLAHRQAGQRLTADERFAMKNRILDEKIEMKQAMKKILSAQQFEKLEKMKKEGHGKITKRTKNFKNQNRR